MTENELAKIVVETALQIHRELGPGLLESVYEKVLAYELRAKGPKIVVQPHIPFTWRDQAMDLGFRADIIVEGVLLIELKSVEQLQVIHKKQTLTYLKLCQQKLALLINFGGLVLRGNISRVVNGLEE